MKEKKERKEKEYFLNEENEELTYPFLLVVPRWLPSRETAAMASRKLMYHGSRDPNLRCNDTGQRGSCGGGLGGSTTLSDVDPAHLSAEGLRGRRSGGLVDRAQ